MYGDTIIFSKDYIWKRIALLLSPFRYIACLIIRMSISEYSSEFTKQRKYGKKSRKHRDAVPRYGDDTSAGRVLHVVDSPVLLDEGRETGEGVKKFKHEKVRRRHKEVMLPDQSLRLQDDPPTPPLRLSGLTDPPISSCNTPAILHDADDSIIQQLCALQPILEKTIARKKDAIESTKAHAMELDIAAGNVRSSLTTLLKVEDEAANRVRSSLTKLLNVEDEAVELHNFMLRTLNNIIKYHYQQQSPNIDSINNDRN